VWCGITEAKCTQLDFAGWLLLGEMSADRLLQRETFAERNKATPNGQVLLFARISA
jgi:hypothetical protein